MDEREQREHRLNEYFKPGPIFPPPEEEAYMKPELDATQTATGSSHRRTAFHTEHRISVCSCHAGSCHGANRRALHLPLGRASDSRCEFVDRVSIVIDEVLKVLVDELIDVGFNFGSWHVDALVYFFLT